MARSVQRLESAISTATNDTTFSGQDLDYDFLSVDVDDEYLDESDISDTGQNVNTWIPYSSLHKEAVSFSSSKRRCFLPGQKIHVTVVDVEVPDSSRLLNPNVYVIEVNHGEYGWTVRRRYKHFAKIHEQMMLFRARLMIPFPAKSHQQRRKSFAQRKHVLPNFQKKLDAFVDDLEKRKEELTNYLQELLRYPQYRNHPEVLKFLEVSHLSFVTQLGSKWKEGMVKKRSGGHKFKMGCLKALKGCVGGCRCCPMWQYRWLVLKDSFVAYIDPEKGTIRDVILMDRIFKVNCGKDNTKIRHGLVISNMNRKLTLRAWTHRKAKEWMNAIDKAAREKATDFTKDNRYDSFAPAREDVPVKWFVDGATYMSAVADALENAKEEIFITDWWLSPEVFMKRPIGDDGAKWRLDVILKRKAPVTLPLKDFETNYLNNKKRNLEKNDEGVKIFVQLYKEMQMALGLNSYYTKETLQNLNPQNIKVLRHPDGIALWSHHEKTVIIDQRIAFLGGIDLCYGRWDTPTHRLHDLGSVGEFNEAEDVPGTIETSTFFNNNDPLKDEDKAGTLPVIIETAPTESADSFRPKFGIAKAESPTPDPQHYYGSFDEPDIATEIPSKKVTFKAQNGTILHSQDSKQSNISASENAVVEGKWSRAKQASLERKKSEWSSSAESESDYSPSASSFSEDDLESPSRPVHKRKIKSVKSPAKIPVTAGERAKHYSRSASLPASAHFSSFSHTSGFDDAGDNRMKRKQKTRAQISSIDETSESEFESLESKEFSVFPANSTSSPKHSTDLSSSGVDLNSIKMDYIEVPDIVIQPASDTEDSRSERSGSNASTLSDAPNNSYRNKPNSSQANSSDTNKTAKSSHQQHEDSKTTAHKTKKKRKIPYMHKSGDKQVIRYATPYEDPKCSDSREKFEFGSQVISYTNDAFEDVSPSDGRERIVFDPHSTSYTNVTVSSDSDVPTRNRSKLDENYNETGEESGDEQDLTALDKLGHHKDSRKTQPGLLKVERDLDAISVGEPQSFRDYIHNVQSPNLLPNGLPTVVQALPRDESGQEEEKQIQRALKKENKKQKKGLAGGNVRKTLTRMKAVEKRSSESDSSSDSDNDRRFKDKSKERHKKKKHKDKKVHRKNKKGDQLDGGDAFLVLSANQLSPPDRKALPFVPDDKPTTPSPKRKLAQKAQDFRDRTKEKTANLKEDIRLKFRKNRSRSMGEDLEETSPVDTSNFLTAQNEDDIINRLGEEENFKLWIGKDYTNFIFKDFVDLDKPYSDFIDRKLTPRMPWHDIGAVVFGKSARDVARHFIQRWNYTKLQKRKDNHNYPLLIPKAYQRVPIPPAAVKDPLVIWSKAQILRSSSHWSAGLRYRECSIQNAYVDLIKNSKHFIYIENQFFVSIMNDRVIQNNIAGALYERIIKAHHEGVVFRVYVILPLLPAFEGELGTATGTSIQAVTHWNYSSICRGGNSLLERLVAAGVLDPFEYISFYGLRGHGTLDGSMISELVYVHSKMMIVDDMKVIIGSANINDRSMIGKRDSEMAVCVEDVQLINGVFNGQKVKVGRFAHSLRMSLFREHLGLINSGAEPINIDDPCIKKFYKGVWMKQASINTDVFEKVFNCLPSDQVDSFQELKIYQKQEGLVKTDPNKAKQLLTKVKGHLVIMPLQFLSKEASLAPSAGTKESLAPTIVWT